MLQVLLDSDTISEVLKARDANVVASHEWYIVEFPQRYFTSASVLEVLRGLYAKDALVQIQRAENLFEMNSEIVPSSADYRLAAEIVGSLAKRGTPVGVFDPLIAACAIRNGLGVATGNTDHFEYIRQAGYAFHVESWRPPAP